MAAAPRSLVAARSPGSPAAGQVRAAAAAPSVGARAAERFLDLPLAARALVVTVIAAGAGLLAAALPLPYEQPGLFLLLLGAAGVVSRMTMAVPGVPATLSPGHAVDFTALLLLHPDEAMVVAIASAWSQCTIHAPRTLPPYRTLFSMATMALAVQAARRVTELLGAAPHTLEAARLPAALMAGVTAYFLTNTGLVAAAIALSSRQPPWRLWRERFLWTGPTYFAGAGVAALAAIAVGHGRYGHLALAVVPLIVSHRATMAYLARLAGDDRSARALEAARREAQWATAQAKRAQDALAAERAFTATLLATLAEGVVLVDAEGRIAGLNPEAARLTGWREADALGLPLGSVVRLVDPDATGNPPALGEETPGTGPAHAEVRPTRLLAREGKSTPVSLRTKPLVAKTGGRQTGAVVVLQRLSQE